MKRILIIAIAAALAVSCKVEKTGQSTYTVTAPTPEAKDAAQKAADDLRKGAKEAAQKTGTALEHAGAEIQEHVGQPTETTSTTSTIETGSGTKTETRTKTTTRH